MREVNLVSDNYDNTADGLNKLTISKTTNQVQKGDWIFRNSKDGNSYEHIMIATGPAINGKIPIFHAPGKGKRIGYSTVTITDRIEV